MIGAWAKLMILLYHQVAMGTHQSLAPCSVKCLTYLHQLEIEVQKYVEE